MLQDRVCEVLRAEHGVENSQRDVRAFDENDSHGNESPIRSACFSAAAQNPVQPSAQEKGQSRANQWTAKEAHSAAGKIEKMAERKNINVGIFVQQIRKLYALRWRMRNNREGPGDARNQQTNDQQNG